MISARMPAAFATLAGLSLFAVSLSRPVTAPASVAASPTVVTGTAAARLRFVVTADGNEARYRVREQLANFEFPNDAVGATSVITGAIVVDSDGSIVREQSKFVVDLRALKSDRDRRDNYIQRRTLETAQHPSVELVPTAFRGLSFTTQLSGPQTFELLADLTIKGVTKPTTWNVTARFDGGKVSGSAATAFTFEDFGMTKPRVASVLSVADTIRLEYDFTLVPETPPASR